MKNHIDTSVTNEGLGIELTESEKGTFFDSGSQAISADGEEILTAPADELGRLPNTLAMEGHTDSKPYSEGAKYGNWELSTDRPNAARRLMQLHGIRPDQVTRVRGFADQRLRKKEDPLDPANRRISLIVQYINKPPQSDGPAKPEGRGKSKKASHETKSGENHSAPSPEPHAAEILAEENTIKGPHFPTYNLRTQASVRRRRSNYGRRRWRRHKFRIVHWNVLLQLFHLNREVVAGARNSPPIGDFHSVDGPVIRIVNLGWVVAKR